MWRRFGGRDRTALLHSYGHALERYVPWSIMLRAVVRTAICETDLWKGARKPVSAVAMPSPAHAGPKPQYM